MNECYLSHKHGSAVVLWAGSCCLDETTLTGKLREYRIGQPKEIQTKRAMKLVKDMVCPQFVQFVAQMKVISEYNQWNKNVKCKTGQFIRRTRVNVML